MSIVYGRFEMPTKIKVEEASKTDTFVRFIVEPFERGFGLTIGNALRRVILSSLEAPAIVSVFLEGVPHEYMAVDGIVEDMTSIILNLKECLLKTAEPVTSSAMKKPQVISSTLHIKAADLAKNKGQISVTLGDVVESGPFTVINPDHHLFTVTKPMKKRIDLKVAVGRGYVSSERLKIDNKVVGEIVIDAIFSPVRLVNYQVENTRVGQDTDFDRLILEVTTDGRIAPQDAIIFASQIGTKHFEPFNELSSYELIFEKEIQPVDTSKDEMMQKLVLRIDEIELSVRSTNCLNSADISTIAELVIKPESDMLKFRNFGKKSLTEIKSKLTDMSLSLGMDLSEYGIDEENVTSIISEYIAAKNSNKR